MIRTERPPDLGRLLDPRTVVAIGGHQAGQAIHQSDRLRFDGEIWPLHPTRQSIAGRTVYRSLEELPGVPDAAFVAVNRNLTLEMVHLLAEMGCGGAVLYASGFAEAGPEGTKLQERLTSTHDMPLVGPNCYGTINALSGAVLWPDVQGCSRVDSGPALISQSGNIALNLTMNRRGVRFSHVISLGNQSSVTAEQCLMYMAAKPEVTAVGLYLESIIDPMAFGRAALACRRTRTPVVMLKAGRTERSERITASHTGALSSASQAYDALFERYGVIVTDTPAEMVTILGLLHTIGPLPGNRLVSLSCSGGEAALVADRAAHHPVVFEPFESDHAARVEATMPTFSTPTNPVDYHTFIWGDRIALERCFEEVLAGPFDAALLVIDWPAQGIDDTDWWPTLRAFETATVTTGTPGIVLATLPESLPDQVRRHATRHGLAVSHSIDEALAAAASAGAVGQWFRRPPPPLHNPVTGPTGPDGSTRLQTLDEPSSKALLQNAGVPIPEGAVLKTPRPHFSPPGCLRFPLVAKIVGPDHKSLRNGVVTGIRSGRDLAAAVKRLAEGGHPVLIEEQITDVVAELLVSVRQEYPLGQVLTIGAGGIHVELFADTTTMLLPITSDNLIRRLAGLRVGKQALGAKKSPTIEALVTVVEWLTDLIETMPDLVEVEINPLVLTSDSAWAVDALVTVRMDPIS